jgi:hypothetical protein
MEFRLADLLIFAVVAFTISFFLPGSKIVRAIAGLVAVCVGIAALQLLVAHHIRVLDLPFLLTVILGSALGAGAALTIRPGKKKP